MALRLVQDDVSYLMNGMDGGNYIPQVPELTWEKRFGDCKAKSLLLLTMLRELGIEAEPVLIRTEGGDALPSLAPMPGNFNHVIVRAVIGGKNYWLDGTTSGVRLDSIDEVPRFFYGLPLREDGADLVKLDTRLQSAPDRSVRLTLDQRAGLRVPAIYDVTIELRGTGGARWRALADQGNDDMRKKSVTGIINSVIGDGQVVDQSIRYDAEKGVAVLTARGVLDTGWERDGKDYRFEAPAQAARQVGFEADRARAAWRAIPLNLSGPVYYASSTDVLLPEDAKVAFEGTPDPVTVTIGGVELSSNAKLAGPRLTVAQSMRSLDEELPADRIAPARRDLARFEKQLPVLRTSGDVRELWQYFGKDRARLSALEALYAKGIAEAEADDITPLTNRASFRAGIYDHAGSLADIEAAMKIEDSRDLYLARSALRRELGDWDGALADTQEAEALQPDGSTYGDQIYMLGLMGRADEGLTLAEDFETMTKDQTQSTSMMASALGWSGRGEEGLELLDALIAKRPADGTLLNEACWQASLWGKMDATRFETCTKAVEKSDNSAAALDSRAMAYFRLGNFAAAKADLDAALLAEPYLTESRLMRGIVRKALGDEGGKEDIALALKMQPSLAKAYKAWGLSF